MADAKLKIVIDAVNNAGKDIEAIRHSLEGLEGPARAAAAAVTRLDGSFDTNAANANRLRLIQLQLADTHDKLEKETDELTKAQLRVRADDLTKQYTELNTAMGASEVPIEKASMSLTDLKSGIDMALGAARTFAAVAKQAFDLSKEGAAVIQTTESFKQMGLSLADLREASGGTIDDMTLMSSAMALLAGASDTLSPALEGSLDELMQIARAASKLNPALGDSAHMFESLALGIKRGSPMILDNLGLTISVAKANEDYAASLGKSVEQLTEEEKKIALLNATLQAGDTLIQQAGGSADAYTDSWARAEAAFKNASDSLKANVAPAMEGTVTVVAKGVTAWSQLVSIVKIARDEYGFLRGSWEAFWSVMGASTDMMTEAAVQQHALAEGTKAAAQGYSDVGVHIPPATAAIEDNTDATAVWTERLTALAAATAEAAREAAVADMEFAKWGANQSFSENMLKQADSLNELRDKAEALRGKLEELAAGPQNKDTIAQMEGLKSDLADVEGQIESTREAMQRMSAQFVLGLIEMRISADGEISEIEARMYTAYATQMGLIDETAASMANTTMQIFADLQAGNIGEEEALRRMKSMTNETAQEYLNLGRDGKQSLSEIIAEGDLTVKKLQEIGLSAQAAQQLLDQMEGRTIEIGIQWNVPPLTLPNGQVVQSPTGDFAYAAGGYAQGGMALVGERGPELVNMPRGAQVYTTKETVNNYTFNLTGNYHTGPTQVDDVRTLAMLYGGR